MHRKDELLVLAKERTDRDGGWFASEIAALPIKYHFISISVSYSGTTHIWVLFTVLRYLLEVCQIETNANVILSAKGSEWSSIVVRATREALMTKQYCRMHISYQPIKDEWLIIPHSMANRQQECRLLIADHFLMLTLSHNLPRIPWGKKTNRTKSLRARS